jgi:hypothetical protein
MRNKIPVRQSLKKIYAALKRNSYEAISLERLLDVNQPANTDIGVCIFAPTSDGFNGNGKADSWIFFPAFCNELRRKRIQTHFAGTLDALARSQQKTKRCVLVCVYNEETFNLSQGAEILKAVDQGNLVFNHPASGVLIGNKSKTWTALANNGCSVPRVADELESGAMVFSNDSSSSGAATYTIRKELGLDESRYNTEFIDTRIPYGGQEFFVSIRLMCINEKIIHHLIRVRKVLDGDPSVHTKDTPQDPDLLNSIRDSVLDVARDEFQSIAQCVYRTFGPGFYCHDTLVNMRKRRAYICETGYKFSDFTYWAKMKDQINLLDGISGCVNTSECAVHAAQVFADLVTGGGNL